VQHGHEPDDWKPMNTVGQGVREIRIRDAAGAFRGIIAMMGKAPG
jgi:phage-related protein